MCVYFMNRIIYFNAEVIQTTGSNYSCRLATSFKAIAFRYLGYLSCSMTVLGNRLKFVHLAF